jgi:hypothetical protein
MDFSSIGTSNASTRDKFDAPLGVTVDNELDGRRLAIHVHRGGAVQDAIDALYERLDRTPGADDRLRCAVSGEDVPFFAPLEIEGYAEQCPDLHWLFAAPTGGADR